MARFLKLSLLSAIPVLIPAWMGLWLYLNGRLKLVNPLTLTLPTAIVFSAYLAAVYLARNLIGNGTIYAASKQADGRGGTKQLWQSAAVSSLTATTVFDVIMAAGLVLLSVCGYYLWRLDIGLAPLVQVVLQIVGLTVVISLGLSLALTRQLGRNAIVIGGLTPAEAFKVGWKLHDYRPVTLLFSLIASIAALASLPIIFVAPVLLKSNLPLTAANANWVVLAIVAVLSPVMLGWSAIFNRALWLDYYRAGSRQVHSQQLTKLMSGRTAGPHHRRAAVMMVVAALTLAGLALALWLHPQLAAL